MSPDDRVLIVGAGIAGLTLACRLRALGIAHDLIERKPQPDLQGAGILLTGNAIGALDVVGVGATVVQLGRRVRRIRFTDQDEQDLFQLDLEAQTRWPPFVSIQRTTLQRVLLDAADASDVRWNTTLRAVEAHADGIAVERSDGVRTHYALVVGADGVHSDLRTLHFGAAPALPIPGYRGWRFLARCPTGLDSPQTMLGNGRTLLLHPLPNGEVYCGAGPIAVDTGTPSDATNGDDLERMRAAFSDFGGHAVETLAHASAATLIPSWYFHVDVARWHDQRCVLIGDAAHACAPTLSLGAALAIEDAVVLADVLASGAPIGDALTAYEQRRRPRVTGVQTASLQRMHANRLVTARALAVRHALLSRIGSTQLLGAWAPLMESSP